MKQIIRPTETQRDESLVVNEKEVLDDVFKVMNITDKTKEEIKSIFYNKSYSHIRSIATVYFQQNQSHIQAILFDKFSLNKHILVSIVNFAQNPTNYFAKCLIRSLKERSLGVVDENILNCVLIFRCEMDMAIVKTEYYKMCGETLEKSIEKHTSGLYADAIRELIGVDVVNCR